MGQMYAERDIIFTRNEADRLPVETVISLNGEPYYTRKINGWVDNSGRVLPFLTPAIDGTHSIHSMPKGGRRLTLKQWQWRLYDVTRTAGRVYGVSGVRETLEQLGLNRRTFDAGVGQKVLFNEYRDDLDRLPIGSMGSRGNPLDDTYEVYERTSTGWTPVMGSGALAEVGFLTIEQVGDEEIHQDWIDAVGTEDDQQEVLQFRSQVWAVGRRAKSNYSWCGTFENVMSRLGIDSTVLTTGNHRVGMVVDSMEAALLPVGTLLTWRGTRTGYTYLGIRVENGRNPAHTRRILAWTDDYEVVGAAPGHYSTRGMTVAALPGSHYRLPGTQSQARRLYEGLPRNARTASSEGGGDTFIHTHGDTFSYHGGTYQIGNNDARGIWLEASTEQVHL